MLHPTTLLDLSTSLSRCRSKQGDATIHSFPIQSWPSGHAAFVDTIRPGIIRCPPQIIVVIITAQRNFPSQGLQTSLELEVSDRTPLLMEGHSVEAKWRGLAARIQLVQLSSLLLSTPASSDWRSSVPKRIVQCNPRSWSPKKVCKDLLSSSPPR